MKTSFPRVASIDVFRAFTMFLMIFVNDLWSLSNIPKWLEHTAGNTDGMGLADIVFPAFLVVMGMSIPYAIQNRLDKGQSKLRITWHIVLRSLALLVMGLFTVNIPEMNDEATGMNGSWYQIIAVASFFLIWNIYPKSTAYRKYLFASLQVAGIIILAILAYIFRGNGEEAGQLTRFEPRWWGILGLIGWAYLGSAIIYLFSKNNWIILVAAWLFFVLFNIASKEDLVDGGIWIVGNGTYHAFTFAGILLTVMYQKFVTNESYKKFVVFALTASVMLVITGFILRNFYIISKIQGTPPWIFICSGISFALFVIFYWLVDLKGKEKWFLAIKTGGTATLTCYLVPYFVYSIYNLCAISLPGWLTTGAVGIMKSIVFSLLIIGIATLIGKIKIKLKI
jgi:heparan-alpha-glucosaminide N-acetyltransferase